MFSKTDKSNTNELYRDNALKIKLGYQTSLTLIHIVVIGYGRNFLKRVIFLSRGTIFLKVALGVSHKDAF